MARFDQGRFVAHENYATDDMEAYSVAPITLLDKSVHVSRDLYFEPGYFSILTSNYASDDLELESPGSIPNLRNGQRHGDCLFQMGKFR